MDGSQYFFRYSITTRKSVKKLGYKELIEARPCQH